MKHSNHGKTASSPDGKETGEIVLYRNGRVNLPESLRSEWLGALIFTVSLPPNGIWIFTEQLWQSMSKEIFRVDKRLSKLSHRMLLVFSTDVSPEPDGSYAIPKEITGIVKLPKKLVLVVKKNRLELRPLDESQS